MNAVRARERFNEPITDDVLRLAVERGRQRNVPALHARSVRYITDSMSLLIGFADESAVVLPVKNYPELASLSLAELNLKTAAATVLRAPAVGWEGRISLRFGCKCRPTMWPTGRSLAAAAQLALHDGLPPEHWRSSIL